MSRPLEHDYIGLTEMSPMELLSKNGNNDLKTELSLGLPGSKSPEKKHGVTIFGKDFEKGKTQTCSSIGLLKGSKRGFSDAIDDCEKWVLSINEGSNGNFGKDCVLGDNNSKNNVHNFGLLKESVLVSCPKPCSQIKQNEDSSANENGGAPAAKAQVVGWPPIRSYRKNTMASNSTKNNGNTEEKSGSECLYVKVSMDGAPYLRKVDLQIYKNYVELSSALEKMFSCFITGSHGHGKHNGSEGNSTEYLRTSEYVLTYEDKDDDWMLVGDVPWKMFKENCRKLRIMKGSEAIGLAPNAAEKCKIQA